MDQLPDEVTEMKTAVAELARSLGIPVGNGNAVSTITVNAGGIGVWIASICCAMMLGMAIVGGALILDQQRQLSDLHDYLAAIYAQAPQLQPPKG